MNWRSIGESLDSADEAALHGHTESAFEIYHSLLSERPIKDRQKQHYLLRRIALGYLTLKEANNADDIAENHAMECFNAALDLSVTELENAMVYYDIGSGFMRLNRWVDALEQFEFALESCGFEDMPGSDAIMKLIRDRMAECVHELAAPGGSPDSMWITIKERPGESTSQILALWEKKSEGLKPDKAT